MRRAAAICIIGLFSVHCGGIAARPNADDGSSDGGPVGDTGVVSDSGTLADAGDEDSQVSCSELENEAAGQFGALAQQYLGCTTDDDCTRIAPQGAGQCVAPCGNVLTDEAGAATLQTAANTACEPFIAAGCKVPILRLPGGGRAHHLRQRNLRGLERGSDLERDLLRARRLRVVRDHVPLDPIRDGGCPSRSRVCAHGAERLALRRLVVYDPPDEWIRHATGGCKPGLVRFRAACGRTIGLVRRRPGQRPNRSLLRRAIVRCRFSGARARQ
jgi:hypothetical protein